MFKFFIKLWQCFFVWKLETNLDHELSTADVIIGQSFGLRKDGPGASNKALAGEIFFTFLQMSHVPVIVQWEIADGIAEIVRGNPNNFKTIQIIRKHRIPGKYLDTREVLFQTKVLCDANNWKKVIAFAHQDHMWRVKMMAERIGFKVLVSPSHIRRHIPYDPLSTQWWTRNRFLFVLKEIPVRVASLFLGWI